MLPISIIPSSSIKKQMIKPTCQMARLTRKRLSLEMLNWLATLEKIKRKEKRKHHPCQAPHPHRHLPYETSRNRTFLCNKDEKIATIVTFLFPDFFDEQNYPWNISSMHISSNTKPPTMSLSKIKLSKLKLQCFGYKMQQTLIIFLKPIISALSTSIGRFVF